jgi:glucose/arabinose dehydrogenase
MLAPLMIRLARVFLVILFAATLAALACRMLLPERFAVNAPLGHLLFGRGGDPPAAGQVGDLLAVPAGFAVDLWATGLSNARFLRFTPTGDLLVSTPRSGRIVLLERDADGDGRSDGRHTLIDGLDRPHGIDLHDGWLYVGETGAIARVRFDPLARRTEGALERVVSDLPAGGNHWTRTVRFGPDGWMYVSIGSSCNACVEEDPRRAALLRFRPDGSDEEIVATGLRNSVGFDWQPGSGDLYATDNGRDLLGDDLPPCELNRIEPRGFYGWPFASGDRVADPDLGPGHESEISTSIPPAHGFRAHNAPLGIAFLRGEAWPEPYRHAAVVALHGSWNRTRKDGYRVVSLHWSADGRIEERPFLTGFLRREEVIGRPVDVAEGPDGAVYVSDDYAGAIYRVGRTTMRDGIRASAAAPRQTAVSEPSSATLAAAELAAARERGVALYEAHGCARCHEAGRADPGIVPVPLDPQRLAIRYDIGSLADYLVAPTPPMPAFPLAAEERRSLAAFLLGARPD